ncbi:MAG: HD domain-containing protein [Deltaproteobacteria bacterium]|nr:HD domain-containing protein [Deltaproteobacteria bacterium]
MTRPAKPSVTKEILTTREASLFLNVTPQTIKNYIYDGKLPAMKTPGGHHRIKLVDLYPLGFGKPEAEVQEDDPSSGDMQLLYDNLQGAFGAVVETFMRFCDARDIVTAGHSVRVAELAVAVGSQLGFSPERLHQLRMASLLHDVGKIGVQEAILGKPGMLTPQEYFLMKQHPEIGGDIVAEMTPFQSLAPVIRHHHERFDGRGYPDGLAEQDIEIDARIIGVAETYDFLRSDLSHRAGLAPDEALDELLRGAGTQFDPHIVHHFTTAVNVQ